MVITLEEYIRITQPSMELHSDLIFIKDLDLRFVYVNPAYLEVSPNSRVDVINHKASVFTSDELAKKYQETDKKILETKKPLIYEQKMNTKYQQGANYLVTKAPILNENGDIIGIAGSARSIEEYVDTREELQTNLNLIETLLDSIPYPIFIKDSDGVYMKVNKAYAQDLNLSISEIIGKDDIELFGEDLGSYYQSKDQRVLRTEERDIYISSGIKPRGKYITTKDVLRDSKDQIIGVVGIVNTFQEISSIQDELIQIERIQSISQLAGGIAHDLNNILTNVALLTNILLTVEHDEQKRSDLETINSSINNASDLINKLKTFAQKSKLQKQEVDFKEILENTIKLVSPKYRKKYDIIKKYCDDPLQVYGDKLQLSQMVMNLIINGMEAMNGGGTLTVSAYTTTLDPSTQNYIFQPDNFIGGNYVCIEVSDTGSGIDSSSMNQIFEPYYSSKGEEGTGLGLSIVYGVVISHDGLLNLDTKMGVGSTFKVYLPTLDP